MTLLQLISALSTKNVKVTLKDADTDSEIITFFSQGIAGIESDVSARTVRRYEITGAQQMIVILDAAN